MTLANVKKALDKHNALIDKIAKAVSNIFDNWLGLSVDMDSLEHWVMSKFVRCELLAMGNPNELIRDYIHANLDTYSFNSNLCVYRRSDRKTKPCTCAE